MSPVPTAGTLFSFFLAAVQKGHLFCEAANGKQQKNYLADLYSSVSSCVTDQCWGEKSPQKNFFFPAATCMQFLLWSRPSVLEAGSVGRII